MDVKKKDANQTGQSSIPEGEQTQQTDQTQAGTEGNVPFHEHPRFQELIAQNRDLREQVKMLMELIQAGGGGQAPSPNPAMTPEQEEVKRILAPILEQYTSPYKQMLTYLADKQDRLDLLNDPDLRDKLTPQMLQEIDRMFYEGQNTGRIIPRKDIALYLAGKSSLEKEKEAREKARLAEQELNRMKQMGSVEASGQTSPPSKSFKELSTSEMEALLKGKPI